MSSASTSKKSSSRAQRRIEEEEKGRRRRLSFIGVAVAVALVVAVTLILLNRDSGDDASDLPALSAAAALDPAIPTDGRTLGDPNAPVTIVEYGDYQCPACAAFNAEAMPQLVKDYIATGKVKMEFHDFPFIGDESNRAAEATGCAVDQGGFWPYHETIYHNHYGENLGNLSEDRLLEMGALAGLDRDALKSCLQAGTHRDAVAQMYAEGAAAGVNSTPSFVVNGQLTRWQGYDALKAMIDAELQG